MALQELGSLSAVRDLVSSNRNVVVTFSAHWCGPCKASKPALQNLATKCASDSSLDVKMGIVYESDLGDDIHQYSIRAFPTHVLFQQGQEVNRVQGANIPGVEEMIRSAGCKATMTGPGATLGGGSAPLSPEDARAARLARLGAPSGAVADGGAVAADAGGPSNPEPAVEAADKDAEKENPDVEMTDANETKAADDVPADAKAAAAEPKDRTADLDPEMVKTLTESMGFTLIRAQKGLLYGNGGTVEGAVEWLMQHQDDIDIDEPIPPTSGAVAQSYKCNDCGKILSNMANLELHANKTGHSDFEESTEHVRCLTAEEKAAKLVEIKSLLKAKRAEREEAEKEDEKEREKQRRFMGKEMSKTREQMEMEQRKRDAIQRKREKDAFKKERARIRAELAKDKAERMANKGKLSSKLGVEGYHPDGIQYDGEAEEGGQASHGDKEHQQKKHKANSAKIDDYIKKVSSYKAGGDGAKCLKVLKAYVGNAADHPEEEKFKSINMDNKAFKAKVKPFIGAKSLLLAVGFQQKEGTDFLHLKEDADAHLLADTKTKLEKALQEYGA